VPPKNSYTTVRVHKSTRELLVQEKKEKQLGSVEAVILAFIKDEDSNLNISQAKNILRAYDTAFSILVEYPDAFQVVKDHFLSNINKEEAGILRDLVKVGEKEP